MIAAFIQLVYSNEAFQDFFARVSKIRDERRIMLNGCSLIWAGVFIDFLLQLRAFLLDRPAIMIGANGVSGLHGGMWREIAWEDLYEMEITDSHIRFVRRPRNAFTRFTFGRNAAGWTRLRLGEYAIHVLLKRIDGNRRDILNAVRRYRPDLV